MQQPRLTFHIGAEKTGTTSLQRCAFEHRQTLAAHGLFYPVANLGFSRKTRNHAPLAASYLEVDAATDYSLGRPCTHAQALASLFDDIGRREDGTDILISSEHLSSRFRSPHIQRLREDFGAFVPRVVIVLRAHAEWVFSSYVNAVRNGGAMRYDDFVRELLGRPENGATYRNLIERWAAAFGRDRLQVIPLSEGDDVIAGLERAGVLPKLPTPKHPYGDNAGLDPFVCEALRRANTVTASDDAGAARSYGRHWLLDLARTKIRNGFSELGRAEGERRAHARACADPALQCELDAAIAEDRRWLRAFCGLDLRANATPERLAAPAIEARSAQIMSGVRASTYGWFRVAKLACG